MEKFLSSPRTLAENFESLLLTIDLSKTSLRSRLSEGYQKVTFEYLARGNEITLDSGYFKGQRAVVDEVRGHHVRVCLLALGLYVVIEREVS